MTMVEIRRPCFLGDVPACDPPAVRVVVLMGGTSAEREVSLMSGREVSKALRESGFQVKDVDLHPGEVDRLAGRDFDVAFISLHGTFGEDGTLQRRLDEIGIAYTGSGPEASRLAMDKVSAKTLFVKAGLPTPEWRVVPRGDGRAAREAYDSLGPNVVAKPINEGSSVAVTLADTWEEYEKGLSAVFAIRGEVLVERMVRGRELTVGVLADEGLPVVEIIPAHRFYDYDAKYFDDATRYVANPTMPPVVEETIRRSSVLAHQALGCRDFSRVDLMLGEDGAGTVLEVNTIPGFTTHSLLPKSAAAAGIDFPRLCRYIVEMALCRSRNRARRRSL